MLLRSSKILKPSPESKPVTTSKPLAYEYNYSLDVPTMKRPHDRHRRVVVPGNPQATQEIAEPCPCQARYEHVPPKPFPTEYVEKQFWKFLHSRMPFRDAREAAVEKEEDNGEGSSKKKTKADGRASGDGEKGEPSQPNEGGENAAESAAERAERERQQREDETRIALYYKFKEWLLPLDATV